MIMAGIYTFDVVNTPSKTSRDDVFIFFVKKKKYMVKQNGEWKHAAHYT